MLLNELYSMLFDNTDFKLDHPENNKWYRTNDAFFPDANQREYVPEYESYEDWTEYIDDRGYLDSDELEGFMEFFRLGKSSYFNDKIISLLEDETTIWLKKDSIDDTFEFLARNTSDLSNEIQGMTDDEKLEIMGIEERDLYIDGWETTIGELCDYGGTVYHYTTEENWRAIRRDKEIYGSCGTGLTNRSCTGVFTSVSPETYASGTYGDVLLEIDLTKFKNEKGIQSLNLQPEPDVLENAINNAFFNRLSIDDDSSYIPGDMSPLTVIVGHSVPLKYIKRL